VIGVAIIVFEWRLRAMSLKRLIGAAIGSVLGIVGAYLFALVIRNSIPSCPIQSFLQIMVMLVMAYVGLAVGAPKDSAERRQIEQVLVGADRQSHVSHDQHDHDLQETLDRARRDAVAK